MKPDAYTKIVLTVIAGCLLWISVKYGVPYLSQHTEDGRPDNEAGKNDPSDHGQPNTPPNDLRTPGPPSGSELRVDDSRSAAAQEPAYLQASTTVPSPSYRFSATSSSAPGQGSDFWWERRDLEDRARGFELEAARIQDRLRLWGHAISPENLESFGEEAERNMAYAENLRRVRAKWEQATSPESTGCNHKLPLSTYSQELQRIVREYEPLRQQWLELWTACSPIEYDETHSTSGQTVARVRGKSEGEVRGEIRSSYDRPASANLEARYSADFQGILTANHHERTLVRGTVNRWNAACQARYQDLVRAGKRILADYRFFRDEAMRVKSGCSVLHELKIAEWPWR